MFMTYGESPPHIPTIPSRQFNSIPAIRQNILQFKRNLPLAVDKLLKDYLARAIDNLQVSPGWVIKPDRKESPRNRRPDGHFVRPL
jgi:hypothetical protein